MKVTGTESGGKSAYQGDDGRFYDSNHRAHSNEREANAHIDFEIKRKENLGINTITGIDAIIILITTLIICATCIWGLKMLGEGRYLGILLVIGSILPIYHLYKFFFIHSQAHAKWFTSSLSAWDS
ncbi:twitching motility protein PilT [Pseudomonas syringae pv. broussonetiae]|uniref:Uncharacterized protein n=1 Tax=Pseudomonas savastanoi TaxID=29438 RepID=A0A3M5KAR9_PSESS|nr:hypothetical protein [Pseudomonas savastanoi]KPW62254.1 twitching motility protein PilT [Pseudomonas syringae pv. broussonetiae]RMT32572.1 hypothetical protein ALP51_03107 [Pseudomonas savastanoi]